MTFGKSIEQIILPALVIIALLGGSAPAAEVFLRAEATTKTMPDGQVIPMWGFARDSAFDARDGVVSVPGPELTLPPGDTTLTIHLDNNLAVPVSIIIPGQITAMTPVRNPDGRARSLTHETQPGNPAPVDYVWSNFRPGTYLYQSGTHLAVQVQMGLYGAAKKDNAQSEVYPGVSYDREVVLLFSEIDPVLHQAVATDNYGPGKAMTSTINYEPRYFLINGQSNAGILDPLAAGEANQRILLRFLNAGLKTRAPLLKGLHMRVVAEDGRLYPYTKTLYALTLPAAKTMDAIITPTANGIYSVFDRKLGLSNAGKSAGGMIRHLVVGPAACRGDINGDGKVDWADFDLLAADWGRTDGRGSEPYSGDLNADGKVDWADFTLLSEGFTRTDCPRQ